ncbi:2Fe-2S iron-sulfur cluster-binding protein [Methylomicrobium sp. Wu6]|uniref:2Fe-2S iron-sulfur cluster-binding protein n=1 Tax=Methylomicrobium sp. Wu6 TaxID=3107928 RepID=UPI002DD69F6E|nr:2Fe-2S iron-sulfur cluster-binding protein [Methylomicrobium sp. Wu6]MEC4749840.1 2Fe-2S iron-sulfur cluster-binding protein [Methylomicrobium sp. Wu6]
MFDLTIENSRLTCRPGETVLDALLRENINIPYGCKAGVCQSCVVQSLDIKPPEKAQGDLKDTLKSSGHFLACQCHPEQPMTLKLPNQAVRFSDGIVVVSEPLNRNTHLLIIQINDADRYKAGQFVNLQRSDGLTRSYSIANIPHASGTLEFHIRRLQEGRFSAWVHDELKVGHSIPVSEPQGKCFYLPDRREQGILLIGTGTGLAPLAGILADALSHGHSGPIRLFHGSRDHDDLYRINEMRELAEQHPNFSYTPCVSSGDAPKGFIQGRANEAALSAHTDLTSWRVFLCGHPDMVRTTQKQAYLKGAKLADIYCDAFVVSADPTPQS